MAARDWKGKTSEMSGRRPFDREDRSLNAVVPLRPPDHRQLGREQERLDSWKEIATYLKRQVRTVQLWEKSEGLPVRRHLHIKMGSVYAYKSEIDVWWEKRSHFEEPAVRIKGYGANAPGGRKTALRSILAVLPFRNLSDDSEQEYFSDGLMDETMTCLGQLNRKEFCVIGRSSVMQYKNTPQTIDEVGRDLGADFVLEGSVRRSANRVRICVQLTQVHDKRTLWCETYDRELADIFLVQSDVASQIARSLSLELLPQPARFPKTSTRSVAAYESYLKGRYFWNQRTEQSVGKAILHFERAVAEDPLYASAYSGLADCYIVLGFYEALAPLEAMPKARLAALKALELDPKLGEAHASLADFFMHFEWNWTEAEKQYKLAIELAPDAAQGYQWYANYLGSMGRHEEARALIARAGALEPLSLVVNVWNGVIFYYARQYGRAIEEYEKALELDPDFVWAHAYLGLSYEQLGLTTEAISEFEKAIALSGENKCIRAMLAHAYGISGDRCAALRILQSLKPETYLPSYDIAAAYAAIGERTSALEWLDRAFLERNLRMVGLQREPRLDCLRADAHFQEIERQLGLA